MEQTGEERGKKRRSPEEIKHSHRLVERKRTRRINTLLDQLRTEIEVRPTALSARPRKRLLLVAHTPPLATPLAVPPTHPQASGHTCKKDKGSVLAATIELIGDLRQQRNQEESRLTARCAAMGIDPPVDVVQRMTARSLAAKSSAARAGGTMLPGRAAPHGAAAFYAAQGRRPGGIMQQPFAPRGLGRPALPQQATPRTVNAATVLSTLMAIPGVRSPNPGVQMAPLPPTASGASAPAFRGWSVPRNNATAL